MCNSAYYTSKIQSKNKKSVVCTTSANKETSAIFNATLIHFQYLLKILFNLKEAIHFYYITKIINIQDGSVIHLFFLYF